MAEEPQDPQERPIIVDEDWKSQAQREKAQADQAKADQGKASARPAPDEEQIPPASFEMLVSIFATQAIASLGGIPDPIEGKVVVRKPLAKHYIDLLAVIEEKTKGNLSSDESQMLTEALHQLRMLFVASPDKAEEPPSEGPKIIT
ncbi:DUF1844 domain-containing protein [Lignipirellula cremea]|uniref:DUF1844 domain-containing protein n=1 Tax=Lignipirellula cremea TaxID=2528010 RepID=A0A518DNX6_9BACT|nr:DUF1844 domain-containing protein [Lignipirellula cremea]QDU93542.1 hypothetical protein Pla8534_13220 [Lignipirellula cremea]